eukprot:CAMPEP_0177684584 /NCGR_PEP_ID=MMETSP0447-20121125/32517_1 /TAXON_ID=0 /ORGANISM="Stygamoeba regulata, Strain BSH-02190019" /LENGTH=603 /DNA_ID=CAMNT_0019194457 /DNA_START=931 /DNA_END=2742 /DNA_ORIENTATION=+
MHLNYNGESLETLFRVDSTFTTVVVSLLNRLCGPFIDNARARIGIACVRSAKLSLLLQDDPGDLELASFAPVRTGFVSAAFIDALKEVVQVPFPHMAARILCDLKESVDQFYPGGGSRFLAVVLVLRWLSPMFVDMSTTSTDTWPQIDVPELRTTDVSLEESVHRVWNSLPCLLLLFNHRLSEKLRDVVLFRCALLHMFSGDSKDTNELMAVISETFIAITSKHCLIRRWPEMFTALQRAVVEGRFLDVLTESHKAAPPSAVYHELLNHLADTHIWRGVSSALVDFPEGFFASIPQGVSCKRSKKTEISEESRATLQSVHTTMSKMMIWSMFDSPCGFNVAEVTNPYCRLPSIVLEFTRRKAHSLLEDWLSRMLSTPDVEELNGCDPGSPKRFSEDFQGFYDEMFRCFPSCRSRKKLQKPPSAESPQKSTILSPLIVSSVESPPTSNENSALPSKSSSPAETMEKDLLRLYTHVLEYRALKLNSSPPTHLGLAHGISQTELSRPMSTSLSSDMEAKTMGRMPRARSVILRTSELQAKMAQSFPAPRQTSPMRSRAVSLGKSDMVPLSASLDSLQSSKSEITGKLNDVVDSLVATQRRLKRCGS